MTTPKKTLLLLSLFSLTALLPGCPGMPGTAGAGQDNLPPGMKAPPGMESGGGRTLMGTTITAPLASMVTASSAALTVALCHLFFNVFGIVILYPLRGIPIYLATQLGRLAVRNRLVAIAYILCLFFLIPLGWPVIFYGLEFLVGFIQAIVFAGLTLGFAMIAVAPHEEEEH